MKKIIFYPLLSLSLGLFSFSAWAQSSAEGTFPVGTFQTAEWTVTFMDDGNYEVALMDGSSISGTYIAEGDRVKIKDSMCGETEGIYTWKLEEGELTIEVVEDACYDRKDASGMVMKKVEG